MEAGSVWIVYQCENIAILGFDGGVFNTWIIWEAMLLPYLQSVVLNN